MPFSRLDTTAIARCLAPIADRPDDWADAFFERVEEVELPADGAAPGIRVRREQGLAVRLMREGRTWLVSRDAVTAEALEQALRQAARALPSAPYPVPRLELLAPGPLEVGEVLEFPALVQRRIRERHAAFPYEMRVRRHRRWVRVVGTQLVAETQEESFYSCDADLVWGRFGAVLEQLGEAAADEVAAGLVAVFRSRDAAALGEYRGAVVLAPPAVAVMLHEAVAHALETDTLVQGGRTEAAVGVEMGSTALSVLDDPGNAPAGVCRQVDDEGMSTIRRWLLRQGRVEQPLADLFAARGSAVLTPGAGRRSTRHDPPVPRSTHLELLPGDESADALLAGAGLFVPRASRGRLDPITGAFSLDLPFAHRVDGGRLGELIGPCRLRGRVSDLLTGIEGIGTEVERAGAGWCAKDGYKLAVWASTPALRLATAEVSG